MELGGGCGGGGDMRDEQPNMTIYIKEQTTATRPENKNALQ